MKLLWKYALTILAWVCGLIILACIFNIGRIVKQLYFLPTDHALAVLFIPSTIYLVAYLYIIKLRGDVRDVNEEIGKNRGLMKEIETSINRTLAQHFNIDAVDILPKVGLPPYERNIYDRQFIKHIDSVDSALTQMRQSFERRIVENEKYIAYLKACISSKDEVFGLLKDAKDLGINRIASLYADFLTVEYDITARYLKTKRYPAPKKADEIKELGQKTREYIQKFKILQYKYEELFILFPELEDYADSFESLMGLEDLKSLNTLRDEYDRVRDYISKEEYQKLTGSERNQLALDRYVKGEKTSWQVGRDYELYIGHVLKSRGYTIWHYGIEKRLEDLGCDIIAIKDNEVRIIQCKCWREDRKIHEKHIMYLYGTCELLKCNYKNTLNIGLFEESVSCNFISTHQVSDVAQEIAKRLGVALSVIPFREFPRIKCNISNGNRIYHLPFDQQYDKVKIDEGDGDFYAMTVDEAESKGFRRAYKWRGNLSQAT